MTAVNDATTPDKTADTWTSLGGAYRRNAERLRDEALDIKARIAELEQSPNNSRAVQEQLEALRREARLKETTAESNFNAAASCDRAAEEELTPK